MCSYFVWFINIGLWLSWKNSAYKSIDSDLCNIFHNFSGWLVSVSSILERVSYGHHTIIHWYQTEYTDCVWQWDTWINLFDFLLCNFYNFFSTIFKIQVIESIGIKCWDSYTFIHSHVFMFYAALVNHTGDCVCVSGAKPFNLDQMWNHKYSQWNWIARQPRWCTIKIETVGCIARVRTSFTQKKKKTSLHRPLWHHRINIHDIFGWSLLAILIQTFIDFTCNWYWVYMPYGIGIAVIYINYMIPHVAMLFALVFYCSSCFHYVRLTVNSLFFLFPLNVSDIEVSLIKIG